MSTAEEGAAENGAFEGAIERALGWFMDSPLMILGLMTLLVVGAIIKFILVRVALAFVSMQKKSLLLALLYYKDHCRIALGRRPDFTETDAFMEKVKAECAAKRIFIWRITLMRILSGLSLG